MKRTLLTLALLVGLTGVLSGCTNQSVSDEMQRPEVTQMPEGETELMPVKAVDPMVNASAGAVINATLDDMESLADDLQSEPFTDLPSDLGQ